MPIPPRNHTYIIDLEVFDIRLLNNDENWILLDLKKEDIKSIKKYDNYLIILTKDPLPDLDNICVFSTLPEVLGMRNYEKMVFITKLNDYELQIILTEKVKHRTWRGKMN